jgi:hypothetical protein
MQKNETVPETLMQKRNEYVDLWTGLDEGKKQAYISDSLQCLQSREFGQVLAQDYKHYFEQEKLPEEDSFVFFFLSFIQPQIKVPKQESCQQEFREELQNTRRLCNGEENFIKMSVGCHMRKALELSTVFLQVLMQKLHPLYLQKIFSLDEASLDLAQNKQKSKNLKNKKRKLKKKE